MLAIWPRVDEREGCGRQGAMASKRRGSSATQAVPERDAEPVQESVIRCIEQKYCSGHPRGKRSVPPSPYSAEQRDGVAADLGGEHVAEVGKEGAALQAAGDRGREQPRDGALALLGLAAQRELA